jgi:hypothetical protein
MDLVGAHMRWVWALAVLLLTLKPLPAAQASVDLWVVDDAVRVNPVTDRLFIEDRVDIHKDYPRTSKRDKNLIWDRASSNISLRAARNEFVSFQLIVSVSQPIEDLDVEFSQLVHPSGARLSGKQLQVFKEWYVQVLRPSTGYEASSLGAGWYPDALLPKRPANLASGFPFGIPDLYNKIPNQKNHGLWIDIFVPFERNLAPPGQYTGTLEVSWKGGRQRLHVTLQAWDFALPQENHLKGDIWNGSMKQMPPDEELRYYQLAQQHRFLPLVYAYRPKLNLIGTQVQLDWSEYDRRVDRYLTGSAFTSESDYWGPGYGAPVDHWMLPFDIEKHGKRDRAWPVPLPAEGRTRQYEAIWMECARQIREHLDQKPEWKKVKKIAFLDGLDESYDESSYEKMIYYGRLLHDALGRGWFQYRIDGGYSREAMEKLSSQVDLWVCHSVSFDLPVVNEFRQKGVDSWFYGPMLYEQRKNSGCGSNTFLDLDLNINRAIGWIGWKYQTGWVEWEFDWNAYAAWYEAENYKEPDRIFNGSGQLIYRGVVMGYQEPIPSIRLKAQRRGLQDYEYFWLLTQRSKDRKAADQMVNEIIYKNPFGEAAMLDTEIWRNDPALWEAARIKAGDAIARQSQQ